MIAELLLAGKENARTGRELADITRMDIRSIAATVQRERKQGAPICAASADDCKGYYLAESQEEMQEYIRRLQHREREIAAVRRACAKTIPLLPATESTGEEAEA